MNQLGWGARRADDILTLCSRVMRDENAAREYTKIKRAKPFMALRSPGAEKRMVDTILSYVKSR